MKLVTANRLDDGTVVFYDGSGWTDRIVAAARLSDGDALDLALAAARRDVAANIVVEPYEIDVTVDEGRPPVPVRLRERIRVGGPTTGHSRKPDAAVAPAAHFAESETPAPF